MSLVELDIIRESTFAFGATKFVEAQMQSAATISGYSGQTTFSGNFGYAPQLNATASCSSYGQRMSKSSLFRFGITSEHQPITPHIFSVTISEIFSGAVSDQMPDELTKAELYDIHQGIMEIKAGKAKQFNTMRETIEWLHRKRAK
jgi:hypothetical protein